MTIRKLLTYFNGPSKQILLLVILLLCILGCYPEEGLNVPVKQNEVPMTELDLYIKENFTEKFNMVIRYRYEDRFVAPGRNGVPPKLSTIRPMLDFIQDFWVEPYLEVENGEEFFTEHVPKEIVFLGGFIFNDNGTVILGVADAGAQITFTNVNAVDPNDNDWRTLQLQTVYHEFAHTVHQKYSLPVSFENISPRGYTSAGSWFTLTDDEALQRGFTSPYATSSVNEDFAETVAFFLSDPDFDDNFINEVDSCTTEACESENTGRALIKQKLSSISDHYFKFTGVKLQDVRNAIQSRL